MNGRSRPDRTGEFERLIRILAGAGDGVRSLRRAMEGSDPPDDALERIRSLRDTLRRAEQTLLALQLRGALADVRPPDGASESAAGGDVVDLLVRSMR